MRLRDSQRRGRALGRPHEHGAEPEGGTSTLTRVMTSCQSGVIRQAQRKETSSGTTHTLMSRFSSSSSASHDAPLLDPVVASASTSGSSLPPLLHAAIHCEGVQQEEAFASEIPQLSRAPLRSAAVRTEKTLERAISFASKDERLGRVSRPSIMGSNADARLPASVAVHVLRRHGHAFSVVTLAAFEAEFANRFCEDVCAAYASAVMEHVQSGSAQNGDRSQPGQPPRTWRRLWRREAGSEAQPTTATPNFAAHLSRLLHEHSQPARLARLRRLRQVTDATREVTDVLEEAVDRMLATGQNLNELDDKSEWLLAQATTFHRSTRSYRRIWCCRSYRARCTLWGVIFLLVVGGAVVIILQLRGAFDPTPPGNV
jgi:hypothetical protein